MPKRYLAIACLTLAACSAPVPGDGPVFSNAAFILEEHPLVGVIWDVEAAQAIDEATLVARLGAADIAILGEVHDNARHHERQAELVAQVAPEGLAFEMVPEGSEEGIEAFLAQGGTPGEIGPAIGWNRLGWPDWDLYRPIFEAAPEAYIAGGATTNAELIAAIRGDAASAFGPGADRYGLSVRPDAKTQAALEEEMVVAHCNKLPRSAARGMAEAQRLRDARFADASLRALAKGNGNAVLITGNGHARSDRGVPAYITEAARDLVVISLGQLEVIEEAKTVAEYAALAETPYDYLWFSARADRPDPCAQFN
ncbi:MAG: ChaN family lipoprotein [Pseudomonadota bacterium]